MSKQIIREFNGNRYSRRPFGGYTHRFKVEFNTDSIYNPSINIFTDTKNDEVVSAFVDALKTKRVISFKIIHKASKEQDVYTAKFIDETLKDW